MKRTLFLKYAQNSESLTLTGFYLSVLGQDIQIRAYLRYCLVSRRTKALRSVKLFTQSQSLTPKAVEVCKENVEKASKNLNIDFKYDIATSEKFLLQLEEEFDLIHFVHVISWLKGYEAILARCFEKLLAKNGLIALVDFNPASFGCESEECCKENAEKTPEIKEEAASGEQSEEEQDGSMYVKVDLIANKHGWSCKKFPYDLKVDLTEAGKPTEAGRKMACVWMHADGSKMSEEEKEKNRADLINSLTKEEVNGETKYFYVLNEMIYFLTK